MTGGGGGAGGGEAGGERGGRLDVCLLSSCSHAMVVTVEVVVVVGVVGVGIEELDGVQRHGDDPPVLVRSMPAVPGVIKRFKDEESTRV